VETVEKIAGSRWKAFKADLLAVDKLWKKQAPFHTVFILTQSFHDRLIVINRFSRSFPQVFAQFSTTKMALYFCLPALNAKIYPYFLIRSF
jgi:hypothetical protein